DGDRDRRRARAERRAPLRGAGRRRGGRRLRRAVPRHARAAPALRALLWPRSAAHARRLHRRRRGPRPHLRRLRVGALPRRARARMTVVTVRGLQTRRGATEVLRGIDLEVRGGEVVAVVGPSGSGKTTLLRALNYLTPFNAGEVEIAGHALRPGMSERADAEALRAVRTRVGMVFQSFNLFPHLTALQNVTEAPRRVLGLDAAAAEARGRALLARVGLAEHAD